MESCPAITGVPQQSRVKFLEDIGHCPKCLSRADRCPSRLCSLGMDEGLRCPSETCPYRRSICPTPFEHMSVMDIKRYREVNRDCSAIERPRKMKPYKGDPPNRHPEEEPKATKKVGNNKNNHETDLVYTNEKRDRLHGVLLQKNERE